MKTEQEFNQLFQRYIEVMPQGFEINSQKVGTWRVNRFKNLLLCAREALGREDWTTAFRATSILIMFFS